MSSSDGSGPAGDTAGTAGPELAAEGAKRGSAGRTPEENGAAPSDPWFEPAAPKNPAQAEWFLPTGRAGLLPDSMSVSWDDTPEHPPQRSEAAGAPPWAADEGGASASTPPPWESGPWPGPGEEEAPRWQNDRGADYSATADARTDLPQRPDGLPAPAVIAAGVVPLVIPGLVVGALGLRRARVTGSGQLASWLAIGLSLAWAVVIVVVVAGSGGSNSGCTGYPAGLRPAYDKAMADLRSGGLGAAQAADLASAASQANTAAAAAQDVSVRLTLSAMAGDLEQAHADVAAQRAVPATLSQHLAAEGAALARSCSG